MRHLGSLFAALIVAPVAWVLLAYGQIDIQPAWDHRETFAAVPPWPEKVAFLAAAGLLIGLIASVRISPLGPLVAGIAYTGYGVVALWRRDVFDLLPDTWTVQDRTAPLHAPVLNGTAIVVGVVLLTAVVSVRRWRRWPHQTPDAAATVDATPEAASTTVDGGPAPRHAAAENTAEGTSENADRSGEAERDWSRPPVPKRIARPEHAAATVTAPEHVANPAPTYVAEPEPEPTTEPEAEPEPEPTMEPEAESEPEPEPTMEPEAEPQPEPEPITKPVPDPDPVTAPVGEREPVAGPLSEPAPISAPQPAPDAEPDAEPAAEPDPASASQVEPDPELEAQPQSQSGPEPMPMPMPEPEPEPEPEPTAEPERPGPPQQSRPPNPREPGRPPATSPWAAPPRQPPR
ncbi:MAG: hypothetical protein QOE03_919 [Micromonosporaceae bacterium]|nr:hypothetical protein [Micromonosporaceae bacterium]